MSSRGLRKLGRSGLQVSPLCLGAMNFGNEQFGCDEEASIGIINAYLDAGLNFIDTANVYSGTKSEAIVGKAVKEKRDNVVIATKAASPLGPGPFEGGTSRKHLRRAVEDSLRRLDTDYIDLYQMHRYDENTPLEETLSTLNDLVREAKVRYIGVSNWPASQIVEAATIGLALAWNLSRPGVVSPIIGPKSVKQLEGNLAALDVTLPSETVERIDAISEPRYPYPHDFLRMARQMTAQMQAQARS